MTHDFDSLLLSDTTTTAAGESSSTAKSPASRVGLLSLLASVTLNLLPPEPHSTKSRSTGKLKKL